MSGAHGRVEDRQCRFGTYKNGVKCRGEVGSSAFICPVGPKESWIGRIRVRKLEVCKEYLEGSMN